MISIQISDFSFDSNKLPDRTRTSHECRIVVDDAVFWTGELKNVNTVRGIGAIIAALSKELNESLSHE